MTQAEHWRVDAGDKPVARLDVPPDALHDRCFEIDVQLAVKAAAQTGSQARHGLRVLIDGQQQWARHQATAPGGEDTLEWRQRRQVPAGQALRIQAQSEVSGASRLRLVISALQQL